MPGEYLTEGDDAFVGLNSRDNPASLQPGILSNAINVRLDRGVARTRKGITKYLDPEMYGAGRSVVGSGVYLNSGGNERILLIVDDNRVGQQKTLLYDFDPELKVFTGLPKVLPARITSQDGVCVIQAAGSVFISRGHNQRPIRWNMLNTLEVLAAHGTNGGYSEFPNCTSMLYYMNRLVVAGRHHQSTNAAESKYTVSVSNFLDFTKWAVGDAFAINQGGNDEVVGMVPWTMNEFLILMRNSSFYLNTGTSRYLTGAPLSDDSALYTLSTDIGCAARRSAVQVSNGVMFLSDNGVYFLQPNPTGSPGVKLLTMSEPISASIDDWIQRINRNHVSNSVAAYWNNRYYLAVPIDGSTKNNAVFVFNFILKNWESIDIYPDTIDFMDFWVAKSGSQRRLFAVDSSEGVLLMEDGDTELFGPPDGTPFLSPEENAQFGGFRFIEDYFVDANFFPVQTGGTKVTGIQITVGNYDPKTITGQVKTRQYTFNDTADKRFSSAEFDVDVLAGGRVETRIVTSNPDSVGTGDLVDIYTAKREEDATIRVPVRRISTALALNINLKDRVSSVRKTKIRATSLGKKNVSKS